MKKRGFNAVQDFKMKHNSFSGENEVLEILFDPLGVAEDRVDESRTDRLKRPHADWEGISTRTQTPSLINFELENLRSRATVHS